MQELLNDLLQAAVPVLGYALFILVTIGGGWGILQLRKRWEDFKLSSPDAVIDTIEYIVDIVVRGVEQRFRSGNIDPKERLQVAVNGVEAWLRTLGYSVELDVIVNLIEAAVLRLKDEFNGVKKQGEQS